MMYKAKESGFGQAEQKAHGIKGPLALYEDHARRNNTPGDHDPRNPHVCAEFLQQYIAGNLEKEITDKEIPAPVANAASLNDRSFSICSLAKPTLTRSRYAKM
jgi:hypothetical protein